MAIERLDIVTSSPARHDSFVRLLPHTDVRRLDPRFTEELIQQPLNVQPAEWPMEMAERKALQDLAAAYVLATTDEAAHQGMVAEIGKSTEARHIRMYSDTITVSYAGETSDETPTVLEKPKDIASWFKDKERGALALSGKNIEICTALTAIDAKNPNAPPVTILVRIATKMSPYTLEDVKRVIEKHGPQAVLTTAGGISLWNGGTPLYDGSIPLKIYLQTDPLQQPVLVNEIRGWQQLDNDHLKQMLYGAVPEAMESMIRKMDNQAEQKRVIDSIPVTVRQASSNNSSR